MSDDREAFLEAARAASFVAPGGEVIHSQVGSGGFVLGADWSTESVLTAIQEAETVQWAEPGSWADILGHPLVIKERDGRIVRFQVGRPNG